MKNNALELYQNSENKYNCAQAIVAGEGRTDLIESIKCCGGGRAEEGRCGALHAALLFIPKEKQNEAKLLFKEKIQSEFCKEIKQQYHTPCAYCVEIAAQLVDLLKK